MTSIEAAQHAVNHGAQLIRPRKDAPGQYDVKDFFSGSKRGWMALDSFSASAIVAVYNAMRDDLKPKFAAWAPLKQATFAFKYVK